VDYVATKEALREELFAYIDHDADVFQHCHKLFYGAGDPLLARAQQARLVREDTDITDVVRMVAGIAKMPSATPEQIDRVLDMALDGLRYRPQAAGG
jgi:hypothetical protein